MPLESCGDPIHTYNFAGYRTELRIDLASYMRDRAKDGDLGDVVKVLRAYEAAQQLAELEGKV